MHPAERPPSSAWERVPLAADARCHAWIWSAPAHAPLAVFINVPDQAFASAGLPTPLTMRTLAHLLGINPQGVAAWTFYGLAFDGLQGTGPGWDYPIPPPPAGQQVSIGVFFHPPAGVAPILAGPTVASPTFVAPGGVMEVLARMDATWNACLQFDQQLASAAKQLDSSLGRVNSLNRDLTLEENRAADQLDKHDWLETRRWLRDIAARVSRFLKEQNLGMTSTAGKRNQYEALYRDFILPRRAFDGMEQVERDLEQFRKTLQTLLNNMNAAHGSAILDGERRAQQVLGRIAAKARALRAKR